MLVIQPKASFFSKYIAKCRLFSGRKMLLWEALDLMLQLGEQIKKPLTFERKRQIVKTFIREIIVYPGKPRNPKVTIKTYFDPPDDRGDDELPDSKPPTDQARNFLSSSGIKKLRDLLENNFLLGAAGNTPEFIQGMKGGLPSSQRYGII